MELGHALSVPEIFLLEPKGPEGGKGGGRTCASFTVITLCFRSSKKKYVAQEIIAAEGEQKTCYRIAGVSNRYQVNCLLKESMSCKKTVLQFRIMEPNSKQYENSTTIELTSC
jgi:hypothetical protein